MTKWTSDQKKAIECRDSSILVSAAAGSGKTAVLVERIIEKICSPKKPIDIDKLLVVTFTNAAATEMKERVGKSLNKAIKKNPSSAHLYRQLTLLNKANINTIHSFCLDIIRANFYKVDIDPNFRIANDVEAELLKLEALEELLETYYAKEEADFFQFVDSYGGQNEDNLIQKQVLDLYLLACSNPFPEYWLNNLVDIFLNKDWFFYLKKDIKIYLEGFKELYIKARAICLEEKGPLSYLGHIESEMSMVEDLLGALKLDWDSTRSVFQEIKFERLPTIKKTDTSVSVELKEKTQAIRKDIKDDLKKIQENYFVRSQKEYIEDLEVCRSSLDILVKLVLDFNQIYSDKKKKANIVDFTDIEHFCLEILLDGKESPENIKPSMIAENFKQEFDEVLIDEYQDINDIQELILSLVSRDDNRFMVGDVKQSIYRFRLAKPELFLEKYKKFSEGNNPKETRIDLMKNFRCHKNIVEDVNQIFNILMNTEVSELFYGEKERLVYGADYPELNADYSVQSETEMHIIEKDIDDDLKFANREAIWVARKVKSLIKDKKLVFDKEIDSYRPIEYKDIVVLMRSLPDVDKYVEEFARLEVPLFAEVGQGYFEATEIRVIVSLLKIIDNPRQDIPLASVLKSPIFDFTSEDLAEIRLFSEKGDFLDCLLQMNAEEDAGRLSLKVKDFLEKLEGWRTFSRQDSLANLIWKIYRDTGYFDYVGAMPSGNQRQANLRILHSRAQNFENTSFRGLFMFLRFVERLKEKKEDLEPARALSENENVVRIMSIHKSKGLEFPVVFISGLGKQFNYQDLRSDFLLHKDLGAGPSRVNLENRVKYPTIAKFAIENTIKRELLAEEIRVLYVAMTRAREKLYLVGSVKEAEDFLDRTSLKEDYKIKDFDILNAKCYLEWLRFYQDLKCFIHTEGFASSEESEARKKEVLEKIYSMEKLNFDDSNLTKIKEKLSWQYPRRDLSIMATKVSVTEVKHMFSEQLEDEFYFKKDFTRRPLFLQEKRGLSPMEKGTAMHAIMQQLDFKKEYDLNNLEEFSKILVEKEVLTEEQRKSLDLKNILLFLESDLRKRMKKAEFLKKELPFSMALKASEIYKELDLAEEKILIQGVIDCLWWEDDGFVILDYKNDYVKDGKLDVLKERYLGQVNLYTRAVEDILKEKVKHRYLYLFKHGEYLEI